MKNKRKEGSKNSVLKICLVFLIIIFMIFIIARYLTDEEFRNAFDTYILKKELVEENLGTIEVDSDTNPYVYAYDRYITVLTKNKLTEYTSDGSIYASLDVNISVPLVKSNNNYLVIAEKNGSKVYLISNANILWQTDIEGNISRVSVNKNGYVSLVVTNSIYKSVIFVFDASGKELFRRYLSTNYAICTAVSSNNKNLAIGEVDYSGTVIKSYVSMISVTLAQSDPENSILYTYESENGEIITNINFENKDSAVCMFNTYIQKVSMQDDERVYDINDNDLFTDIHSVDSVAIIHKQSSGLFSYQYEMNIKSVSSKAENLYILNNDIPKEMIVNDNIICLNFGNEVQFVSTNGWLIKKYNSYKEVTNVIVGSSIAGIVYKDRIEIIDI